MLQFRNAKSLTSVWTYVVLIFFFVVIISIIQGSGDDLLEKDLRGEITLSNDSVDYIGRISGINTSNYQATKEQLEDSTVTGTAGTPKDYAMEFLFSKEKGAIYENPIKNVYTIPSTTSTILLNQPTARFNWIIGAIVTLLSFGVGLAIYFTIRGSK